MSKSQAAVVKEPAATSSPPKKLLLFLTIVLIPIISFIALNQESLAYMRNIFAGMTSPSPAATKAPALFVPHGGGPMPLLNDPGHKPMINFLTGPARKFLSLNSTTTPPKPKAILLVTAHWQTSVPTISSAESHDLYYDYYGFPPETYEIKYPAPGSPSIARRAKELLENGGFQVKLDEKRGWDHGVFVPLKILHPAADIPVIQMSVLRSQDAEEHLRLGKSLAPLRDEGVVIIGSGMTFHNMMALRSAMMRGGVNTAKNQQFHDTLTSACGLDEKEREEKMKDWEDWPEARYSHPEGAAEHFMPLLVVAGAGGDAKGERVLDWNGMGHKLGAFIWK